MTTKGSRIDHDDERRPDRLRPGMMTLTPIRLGRMARLSMTTTNDPDPLRQGMGDWMSTTTNETKRQLIVNVQEWLIRLSLTMNGGLNVYDHEWEDNLRLRNWDNQSIVNPKSFPHPKSEDMKAYVWKWSWTVKSQS